MSDDKRSRRGIIRVPQQHVMEWFFRSTSMLPTYFMQLRATPPWLRDGKLEVLSVCHNFECDSIDFLVHHPLLPEVVEGMPSPNLNLELRWEWVQLSPKEKTGDSSDTPSVIESK